MKKRLDARSALLTRAGPSDFISSDAVNIPLVSGEGADDGERERLGNRAFAINLNGAQRMRRCR